MNTVFQKLYIKAETVLGDSTGNLSAGMRLWPQEKVDIGALDQKVHSGDQVKGSATDLGPKAQKTFRSFDFTTKHILSGAKARTAGAITPDSTSTFLGIAAGAADTNVSAADTVASAANAYTIVLTTGTATYVAGKLIMINGEVRRIKTWTAGTKTLELTVPLTATPASPDAVYTVESWTLAGNKSSAGIGIETDQLPAYDVLALGVICKKFGIGPLNNNEPVMMSCDWSAQDWTLGNGIITNAPTTEIEVGCVFPNGAKGGVAFNDTATTVYNGCVKSAEITNAYETSFVDCIGALNGRGGLTMTPADDGLSKIKVSFFATDANYASLAAMMETEVELYVQVGSTSEHIVGVLMEKAYLKEFIKPKDDNKQYHIECLFAGTNLRLFRA